MNKQIANEIKGFTVTKLNFSGKWMCDIVFNDFACKPNGAHVSSSAFGWKGNYNYTELKKCVFDIFGLELPNVADLVYLGRSRGGKVYTSSTNKYLGADLLNNTFRFLGKN